MCVDASTKSFKRSIIDISISCLKSLCYIKYAFFEHYLNTDLSVVSVLDVSSNKALCTVYYFSPATSSIHALVILKKSRSASVQKYYILLVQRI